MNSPVLTDYGTYRFSGPLDAVEVRAMLGAGFTSAIGHQSTADLLCELLNIDVSVNRASVRMQPADRGIVFRLLERVPTAEIASREELKRLDFEFGLMERLA